MIGYTQIFQNFIHIISYVHFTFAVKDKMATPINFESSWQKAQEKAVERQQLREARDQILSKVWCMTFTRVYTCDHLIFSFGNEYLA